VLTDEYNEAFVIYALQVVDIRSFGERGGDASSQKETRRSVGIALFTGKLIGMHGRKVGRGKHRVFTGVRRVLLCS
jgi:hypothetical protein